MALQTKILLVISLTFVALLAVLYTATQAIVLGSFSEQENQDMRQNVERVRSALNDNLVSLEGTTRDWSVWDDTYSYIQDLNQNYVVSNLSDTGSMATIRLNLQLYVNSEGRVVFQKAIDYLNGHEVAVPPDLLRYIYKGSPLLRHPSPESSITGILALPDAPPMLLASEPIVPSSGIGDIKGTLVFGRFLDKAQIEHLAKASFSDLSFQALDAPNMPADFVQVTPLLTPGGSQADMTHVKVIDASSVAGYTLLKDIYDKPALIMRVLMNRDVYMRGQQTVRYYILTLLGVGVVFGLVILILLKQMILSRLARLSHDTETIAKSGDVAARVSVSGSDELSHLAVSTNNMLSALQKSHKELAEGEERYRAVVEQTTEAIFLIDMETQGLIEANAASQILLGYTLEELKKVTLADILVAESEPKANNQRRTTGPLHTTGSLRLAVERHYRRKNGAVIPVEVSDSHIIYGGRDVLCVVARDITDRKRAEVILRDLAMRDGLTGLYNRRELQRLLKDGVELFERYDEVTALILLDIDHFKSVNDTYGHPVGDDVLRWLSHLLLEMVRPEDKVARYGGEELAVVMPRTTMESAVEIAERIRLAIAARPFEFTQSADGADHTVLIPITVSIGVAVLCSYTDSEQALLEAADQALYEAKHAGRNCTIAYRTLSPLLQTI